MYTYAYARISVDDPSSVSVEDQLAKIQAQAFATGRIIDKVFVDKGASGKSLERPSATEMLTLALPGDTVIVYRLDRLTRSVRDVNEVMELGVTLVSVMEALDTSTAAGRMIINMLATFAQYERELIVERTTASLDHRRKAFKTYGTTPFGYKNMSGTLVPVEEEQQLLGQLAALRGQGHSYESLAKYANASGVKPHKAQTWYAASVRAVLTSKMARGVV